MTTSIPSSGDSKITELREIFKDLSLDNRKKINDLARAMRDNPGHASIQPLLDAGIYDFDTTIAVIRGEVSVESLLD